MPLYLRTEKFLMMFIYLAAFTLVCTMILVVCDIVGRLFFHRPITGTMEICSITMSMYTLMGMGYNLIINRHVRMPALYDRCSQKGKRILDCIIYLLITLFSLVFVYGSYNFFIRSYSINERFFTTITLYVWWGKGIMLIGAVLLLMQSTLHLIHSVCCLLKNDSVQKSGA